MNVDDLREAFGRGERAHAAMVAFRAERIRLLTHDIGGPQVILHVVPNPLTQGLESVDLSILKVDEPSIYAQAIQVRVMDAINQYVTAAQHAGLPPQ